MKRLFICFIFALVLALPVSVLAATTVGNNVSVGGTLGVTGDTDLTGTLSIVGDLDRINNVVYSFPSSQGGANTYLKNNGSGTLTWSTVSGGSGTNDWGRFASTYGALALMTSSTYPVWFDGAVYASSTLITSGNNIFGNSDAAGGDTTRIYGGLGIGSAPRGDTLVYINSTSSLNHSLVLRSADSSDTASLVDLESFDGSSLVELSADGAGGSIQVSEKLSADGRSWLGGNFLNLAVIDGTYDSGKFYVNSAGAVSVSSTLSVFGDLNRINNVAYSFPSSQGGANTYLKNNGSGTLTWSTVAGGSGTNDWGRFESTFDTMSLRTSSTYPVWLDRAFVSSTLIVGGSAGGADDSGLLIYAGAQDSGSELFAIYDKAGRSLLSFATSSNLGASVLTVGNLTSPSAGGNIVLNAGTEGQGGLFVLGENNDFNNVFALLTGESEGGVLMLGSGNVTSTFSASYLQLGETWDSNGEPIDNGKFYVDATNGNTSASGTVKIHTGGSAGKAMCWKADGVTLGYCSSAVGAGGDCTCN